MKITFDSAKDRRNRQLRRLLMSFAVGALRAHIHDEIDDRRDYGEQRRIAYGLVEGRLHVCVYALRDDEHRIISLRKAN